MHLYAYKIQEMKGKNIYIIWWCLAISHEQESCILQEYLNKLICDIDFIQQNNKQANIKKKIHSIVCFH